MNTFTGKHPRLATAARIACIGLALATAACEAASARERASAKPGSARYFGDEHAAAQQALLAKPAAEIPPTF